MKKAVLTFLLSAGVTAHAQSGPAKLPKQVPPIAKADDGGGPPSEGRAKVSEFFEKLKKTDTAAVEKKVLIELAKWLKANGYKIEVEVRGETHRLTCPYFPPVTPWVDHRFREVENLKIIPHRMRPQPD